MTVNIEVELKRAYKTGKIEVGLKDSEKSILLGKSKAVVMSSAASDADKIRLKYLCDMENIKFILLDEIPLEFGQLIGLSYPVTAVSIINEGKSKILQE